MKTYLVLEANREGYEPKQIYRTLTVGELRKLLEDYDDDTPIFSGSDYQMNSDTFYTYGGFNYGSLKEIDIDED